MTVLIFVQDVTSTTAKLVSAATIARGVRNHSWLSKASVWNTVLKACTMPTTQRTVRKAVSGEILSRTSLWFAVVVVVVVVAVLEFGRKVYKLHDDFALDQMLCMCVCVCFFFLRGMLLSVVPVQRVVALTVRCWAAPVPVDLFCLFCRDICLHGR